MQQYYAKASNKAYMLLNPINEAWRAIVYFNVKVFYINTTYLTLYSS